MKSRTGTLAVLALALAAPATAGAAPATVDLRVEGEDTTIFEGTVRTDGHAIEQDKSGPQRCDGTNAGANPTPGPTVTSALDDAVAWDGTWNRGFSDFLVNRIGPDAASDTEFWGTALNFRELQVGGCQARVKSGDDVLWAYDLFSKKQYLKLRGPRVVRKGNRFRVRVVDAKANDKPVKGALVRGARTNAKGLATFRATKRGTVRLKATRSGALRSNSLFLRVR